ILYSFPFLCKKLNSTGIRNRSAPANPLPTDLLPFFFRAEKKEGRIRTPRRTFPRYPFQRVVPDDGKASDGGTGICPAKKGATHVAFWPIRCLPDIGAPEDRAAAFERRTMYEPGPSIIYNLLSTGHARIGQ